MIKKVSLETAKKLHDVGFYKETEYRWVHLKSKKTIMESKIDFWKCLPEDWDVDNLGYAAPTSCELLDELPKTVKGQPILIGFDETIWWVTYAKSDRILKESMELCEALAQVWIYLKKEDLLTSNP